MASYLIKKQEAELKIIDMDYDLKGYKFKPNAKAKQKFLKVNQITIINPVLIDGILTTKFEKKYRRLVMIAMSILQEQEEDTNEWDVIIALNEIARLREIILKKNQKFIKKEKEEKFIKQLRILENELRARQISIRINMLNKISMYEDSEKSFGR